MPDTREGAVEGKPFQEDNSEKYIRMQAVLGVPPCVAKAPPRVAKPPHVVISFDPKAYNQYKREFKSQLVELRRKLENVRRAAGELRGVTVATGWRLAPLGKDDDSKSAFVERQLERADAALAQAGKLEEYDRTRYYILGREQVASAEDAIKVAWNCIREFLRVKEPVETWARRANRMIEESR